MNEVIKITARKELLCTCGAKAKDTPTERGRFLRRHPSLCVDRQSSVAFTRQLASGVRSVNTTDEAAERRQRWPNRA